MDKNLVQKLDELRTLVMKPSPLDSQSIQSLIIQLKIACTTLPGLDPSTPFTSNSTPEFLFVRELYELIVISSVKLHDFITFERHVSYLKSLYFDYSSHLESSSNTHLILSLNLMNLLSQNRIAEFHTELEFLVKSIGNLDSFPMYQFPLELEQFLMDGSYQRILKCIKEQNMELFDPFCTILVETVRDEIATCIEKAYDVVSISYVKSVLFYDDPDDVNLMHFCKDREWTFDQNTVHFNASKRHHNDHNQMILFDEIIPTVQMMKRTICYATELERIV